MRQNLPRIPARVCRRAPLPQLEHSVLAINHSHFVRLDPTPKLVGANEYEAVLPDQPQIGPDPLIEEVGAYAEGSRSLIRHAQRDSLNRCLGLGLHAELRADSPEGLRPDLCGSSLSAK